MKKVIYFEKVNQETTQTILGWPAVASYLSYLSMPLEVTPGKE